MKEHYVSYECAIKLKELGFKCVVYTHYPQGDNNIRYTEDAINWNNSVALISAPRLDQAQRWLREEKKWHIIIEPRIWEQQVYDFKLWHYHRGYENANRGLDYLSYESALSAGINMALELLNLNKK